MAERRMFAKTIIDSDVFLDMPLSTQALYFHLAMRADDDGFINNPKKIMRMIGAAQNELEILLAKRYLLAFDSGIVVIKHWCIHNYIAKDRYHETKYLEEKSTLKKQDNKAYTECIHDVDMPYTGGIQSDDPVKVSLDKSSLDKVRQENEQPPKPFEPKPFNPSVHYEPVLKEPTASDFQPDNLPDIATKNMPKIQDDDLQLYKDIQQYFLEQQPSHRFSNYGKEGKAIKGLIDKAKLLKADDIKGFLEMVVNVFKELRKTDKFYADQPFLPSALNSSGIFDRVLNSAQNKYKEYQEANEFDAMAYWQEMNAK
jgi:hypothetical protein